MPKALLPYFCAIQILAGSLPARSMNLREIKDGIPPLKDQSKIAASHQRLTRKINDLGSLAGIEMAAKADKSLRCLKFLSMTRHLLSELASELAHYPEEGLRSTRLIILMFGFAELAYLIESGAEGGYSTLDLSRRTGCNFEQRELLKLQFKAVLDELNEFRQAAYGTPGLTAMMGSQIALLKMAIEDEASENKRFWITAGIGTVASVALWKFVPVAVAAGSSAIWGYTPRLLTVPAVIVGIQSTAVMAEGLAFNYAFDLISNTTDLPKIRIGNWDERIKQLESFLDSPPHAPELQLKLISRVHAMSIGPWDQAEHDLTESELKTVIEQVEMLTLLKGANVEQQIQILTTWIDKKFNFRMQCDGTWGFSRARCLLGMRNFAEALISGELTPPAQTIVVNFAKENSWRKLDFEKLIPEMTVPYNSDSPSLRRFANLQITNKRYLRYLRDREHLDDLRLQLQELIGKPVEIEDRLTDRQAMQNLIRLNLLAAKDSTLFHGPAEAVRISNEFQLPIEQNQILIEKIDCTANMEELENYLANPERAKRDYLGDSNWPQSFFAEQKKYETLKDHIKREFKIPDIQCNAERLTLSDCMTALRRVNSFLNFSHLSFPQMDTLMITDGFDTKGTADYLIEPGTGKKILVLKHNFAFRSLMAQL